jgi:RES domain
VGNINKLKKLDTELISKFQNLDLSKYPAQEVRALIDLLPDQLLMGITLNPGQAILRGRPNELNKRYYSRRDSQYVPKERNKSYKRASTPDNTMFYGCVVPTNDKQGYDKWRILVAWECLTNLFNRKTKKGFQKLTYSRWEVIEPITLVAITGHKLFSNPHPYLSELYESLLVTLNNLSVNKEEIIKFTNFFATEFAKEVDDSNEHEYLISSLFTESLCRKGFDGVLYPSVKVGGDGFNVALTPDAVDNKLNIKVIGECTMYRFGDNFSLSNDTQAEVRDQRLPVNFSKVPLRNRRTQEQCLKSLGVTSLEDLGITEDEAAANV